MTPPPRFATASDQTGAIVAKVTNWKVLASIVAGIFLAGVAISMKVASFATRNDVGAEHKAMSDADRILRSEVSNLETRVTRTETSLTWLQGAVWEIARKVGASAVPPPPVANP